MHELFTKVLSNKDLTRAGDLFSIADSEIVNDLSEVLTEINKIISQYDYLQSNNDQSVVEICITRVLSCIRETKTAERYCEALVIILETCLKHNLQATSSKEDPPHAKISADIISSIFLNYNKKSVMKIALPAAVKFLQKYDKGLSKNVASCLSLAAIEYAYLLSPHVQPIIESILAGNYVLCPILSQIYDVSPEQIIPHTKLLVAILSKCDGKERESLLQLFVLIAQNKPSVLEESIPQLCDHLTNPITVMATLQVLLQMAKHKPHLIIDHFDKIKQTANSSQSVISLVAQILSTGGKHDKEHAQIALDFVLEYLPHADRTSQNLLLHEATILCSTYPILFTDKVLACVRQRNNLSQQQVQQQLQSQPSPQQKSTIQPNVVTSPVKSINQTSSGGVTIVNLNTTNHIPVTNTVINGISTGGPQILAKNQNQNHINHYLSQQQQHQHQQQSTITNMINNSTNNPSQIISTTSGHIVTIHTSSVTSANTNTAVIPPAHPIPTSNSNNHNNSNTNNNSSTIVSPTPSHTGYTRRSKLGDSRSTGRLHGGNTHRSMTRLNIAGGSIGGLHKSMTRLSSSQHINQNGGSNTSNINNVSSGNLAGGQTHLITSQNYVTPVPPLSSNVIITGHNKWGIPSTKIQCGGVTVTTSPTKIRPHSQDPIVLMGGGGLGGGGVGSGGISGGIGTIGGGSSTDVLGKLSGSALNQSTGSIGIQQNTISVHHASPASPTLFQQNINQQKSIMTLPVFSSTTNNEEDNEVIVSGPTTVTSRQRNDNTSVTLINANKSIINQRMSTFEPYQIMRDTVQQFCEKHFSSIKIYMDKLSQHLPPPIRCAIEEKRTKKIAKLHFACQTRGPHCLYSKTCFIMKTRNPKTWIHLMFLDFQIRNYVKDNCALSTREPGISNLKYIWNMIKTENKSFTELVTSNFPSYKEQEILVNELRHAGFLDVFEVSRTDRSKANANELEYQWGCFLCNHPEKAVDFLQSTNQPMIEGQLKEKKGKWRLFRRWRTRYFTLSGAHLSCKGSSGGESIDVNQIRSVKVSRGARNIPKAFEIFTGDQTLILKPKNGKNAEEWVQCLSIAVAHSQARDTPTAKTNSLPARGLGNSRGAF